MAAVSLGLKMGMHYLCSRPAADAINFTVDSSMLEDKPAVEDDDLETKMAQMVCSLENRDECMACGSAFDGLPCSKPGVVSAHSAEGPGMMCYLEWRGPREAGFTEQRTPPALGSGRITDHRDYDYFGFKTLERSCLLKIGGKVVERPQHMLMRVVVGIHKDDIDFALKTYHLMSQRWFTHALPTLFNAGTPRPQLSNSFLICTKCDCIEGIYDTLKECAVISKSDGGIGVSVHNIRATDSYIRGTNGIVPMLKVLNHTAGYVEQEGGKRKCNIFYSLKNVLNGIRTSRLGRFLDIQCLRQDLFHVLNHNSNNHLVKAIAEGNGPKVLKEAAFG
ncbi:hypothetical protein EJ110_NYTH10740 [Nymphaea thermarum]|nr:hypothetical protein EJ110_NYTH10740 [Nymphaea thermarum]